MLKKLFCSSLLAILLSLSIFAQSEAGSASIEGTVKDSNGAIIQGATVLVKNTETGLERTVSTNSNGGFIVSILPVGNYKITVKQAEFADSSVIATLTVGETTPIEISLNPKATDAVVDITADGEIIDAEAPSTGTSIPKRAIEDLPVRGRNFTEFVQLTPAVIQEGDRNGLVIAGQRSINSNVAIDGADFNDALQGNQRGGNEQVFSFPQTAIREFQVVRSGATAEIGRTGAGFVNAVTKSGTNNLRGEAFYYNRNKHLTSPDAFGQDLDNAQNQFGGSIGGAIKQDKAFFFLALEQNFLRVPFVVQFQNVPGVTLPANLAAKQGEQRGTNNPTAIFGRTDFVLTPENTLNIQYSYTRFRGENFSFENPRQDIAVESNYTRKNSSNGLKASLVTVFTPQIINEMRAQVGTDKRLEEPNTSAGQAVVVGFGTLGGDRGRPRRFESTRVQFTDNLSWDLGKNNLRFGFDANINDVLQQRESNSTPRFDFENRTISGVTITALENFINVRPRRFRQSFPTSGNLGDLVYEGQQKELALFFQDKIKVSSRLSLNAGLRWEGQYNPQPKNPNPLFPQTALIPNDVKQWQPRVGLAYDVTGTSNTVIRLSAGIFAARTPANLFQRVTTDNGLNVVETEIAEVTACRNSTVVNLAGCPSARSQCNCHLRKLSDGTSHRICSGTAYFRL